MTKTTTLEAVNVIIACIGESPVNSLDQLSADAAIALNVLNETCREVQSRGWHFNTVKRTLVRDQSGRIPLAENCVRVDTDWSDQPDLDVGVRGDFLHDLGEDTEFFRRDVKDARLIVLLDFEEMPESARRYCMIRAGRIFADRMVASEKINAFTRMDEQMAWVDLREYESDVADRTIFDHPDVGRTLHRTR